MWQSVLLLEGTRVFRENPNILLVTFNNISVIMWQSVLLLEGTRVFRENRRHFTSHFQQYFSYNVAVSFIIGGNQSVQRKPPTFY